MLPDDRHNLLTAYDSTLSLNFINPHFWNVVMRTTTRMEPTSLNVQMASHAVQIFDTVRETNEVTRLIAEEL